MAWKFQREEPEYPEIPEGRYRVVISGAEMAVSKNGNDMLVLKVSVSGMRSSLWNYITFLDDRPEITNRMLTQFFDSFGIEDGDFNLAGYIGKAGGVQVKHDDSGRAKISYFLSKKQQESLPPYRGDIPAQVGTPAQFQEISEEDAGDLPF